MWNPLLKILESALYDFKQRRMLNIEEKELQVELEPGSFGTVA